MKKSELKESVSLLKRDILPFPKTFKGQWESASEKRTFPHRALGNLNDNPLNECYFISISRDKSLQ